MFVFDNKKKFLFYLSLLFIILILIKYFVPNDFFIFKKDNIDSTDTSRKKIKIATALESTRSFLELVQDEFKNKGVDLEIVFLNGQYIRTNQLLLTDNVFATLDSHLPFALMHNKSIREKMSDGKIIIAHPFYFAKIGLYSIPSREKTKDIKDIKELRTKLSSSSETFSILMPAEAEQQSLFLLFLKHMQLIQLKSGINKEKYFDENDFIIPNNLQIIKQENLLSLCNRFRSDQNIDFLVNYPGILGKEKKTLKLVANLDIPSDPESYFFDYTISLITKEKNINSEEIKLIKEILSQQEFIDNFNSKHISTLEMVPIDKMNKIISNVNEKYSS